jgi:prolyl oligopeptidase
MFTNLLIDPSHRRVLMRVAFAVSSLLLAMIVTACTRADQVPDEPTVEAANAGRAPIAFVYPQTQAGDVVETLHGEELADPYRWLEDDVRVNPAVADWVNDQNAVTNAYLSQLPGRDAIERRLTELWNFERFSLPEKRGNLYFFSRNDGLQNQSVFYVQEGLTGAPRALIDPNQWSEDGATALAGTWPSPDGSKLAYMIQDGGSDWRTVKVLDVATGEVAEDSIEWVKFSEVSWAKDGSGFYYSRYPAPEEGAQFQNLNFNQSVHFHALGADQSADQQIYARPQSSDHGFNAQVSDEGRYLLITVWKGTDDRYELVLMDRENRQAEPQTLVSGFENDYFFVGNEGTRFYFRTNHGAPLNRLIAMDVANPAPENWTEIIGETQAKLEHVSLVGGQFFAHYIADARSVIKRHARDGALLGEVALPGLGVAGGFGGDMADTETFYSFSSLVQPPTIFRLDIESASSSEFKAPQVPFDPAHYAMEQVFYASRDGTRIPMMIAYKKGTTQNGANPTLLYGYGGFNISILPSFSITRLGWMDMGGVYAVANLRGGGEYGKAWHDAGRLANKQNVFDDFAAAAVYLHDQKWASPQTTAIYGRSNGGLLVGATVNQRPELFSAALPAVGVMDMLRFHKFTAGRFWVDDYGNPEEAADFAVQKAYSPYHNIASGTDYPAIMVTTADTDDRVVPGHSFKYTAALQAADLGDKPQIIRIETRAGHGAGTPTAKLIEEYADKWAFIGYHTGLELAEGYGQ